MLLGEVSAEYYLVCESKGFTAKTMTNKRQELKQLLKFLEDKRGITELESVSSHDVKAYVRYKQQSGLKPQSIVSMLKMVKAFFRWCHEEEYLKEDIVKSVKLPKVPKTVIEGFTNEEVAKMIDAFSYKNYIEARNKCIIAMLGDTGIRNAELRTMEFNNVLKGDSIVILGKGNKERYIYPSPITKRIMLKYERMRAVYFKDKIQKDETYFLSYKGTMLSNVALDNVVKEAGKRAGIENKKCSPHSFRHFYAVHCLLSGMDIYTLSRILGHSEISITQRYLQSVTDQQVYEVATKNSPLMNLKR